MSMDEVLFALLRKNANKQYVRISTTDLAKLTGMSQQNASRRVIELEKEGIIQRSNEGIKITEKGERIVKEEYLELKSIFETKKIKIKGKIVEGTKQGGYYLSLPHYKNEIKKHFGFVPFPGTLNIKISENEIPKRDMILKKELISVPGFTTEKRTFGEVFAYPGKLNKNKVVILFPLRTHYEKDIIEVVANKNLKKLIKKEVLLEIE